MAIALSATVIILLLLPGYLFKFGLLLGIEPREKSQYTFAEELAATSFFSVLIHAAAILLFIPYQIRFDVLFKIISDDSTSFSSIVSNDTFRVMLLGFIAYLLIIYLLVFLSGRLIRWLILKFYLDARLPFLRLFNRWYYLFSGRTLRITTKNRDLAIDLTVIDVLCQFEGSLLLYTGYLLEYVIDPNGNLNRIIISDVIRREFKTDTDNLTTTEYEVPGDFMVIDYTQIRNLNISFLQVEVD